ncbi:acyl-CoA dehydrogenase family protein [Blastococcus saxobsidens]|uniref:Putative acyl-CoA dehydrogenase n=1 Tax=Blastococcus saxobsidens (strain DD2) TaxID=1146883 RepID=H6RX19_BLASD|nr:acyl-CoA dehydrogenase family protein [Blastococcus saxobsidens]CCG03427.1 putative acyl-CoA dehydrogenase [Blastococcus saxobsidens DD2]
MSIAADDLEEIRQLARSVATGRIAPFASAVDEAARFPTEGYQALVESQLHAVVVPEAYGGVGADALTSAVVAEEIARVCATTQQVSGANELFAWPLLLAASEEQQRRWLAPIAAGEALGAFALSEPDAGSDVASMTTRAEATDEGWRVRGTKRWITNGGVADCYVLFAVTDPEAGSRGISAFALERTDAGLSFGAPEKKMGLKGSPTTEVYLDDVPLPADRLIGRPGEGLRIALGTLDRTRTGVAAQAVGIAQGALDVAVDHVSQRRQFGKVLAEFQGLQFMLADMAVAVRAARLLTHAAAEEIEAGAPTMGASGAAAKLFASDTAMKVTTDAVQLLGGSGYVTDFPVERMMRDAKITQIYEGTNQIQRIVIARDLLNRTQG